MELKDIAAKIREFRDDRDWAQFHNPKDMAIAISIEVSELLEHFLWKNPEEVQSRIEAKRSEIESEIAAFSWGNSIGFVRESTCMATSKRPTSSLNWPFRC